MSLLYRMLCNLLAITPQSHGFGAIAPARGCESRRRHDPARPKTSHDLERMEAASLKRERKAARKGGAS